MNIGLRIKELRNQLGLTQAEFAKKANISRTYLSDIENNRYNPSIDTLENIAKHLEVPLSEFFNENATGFSDKEFLLVPEEFTNAEEARAYVDKHQIFGSEGFDPDRLDDEEILEFANALLEQMKMVSYKYKK